MKYFILFVLHVLMLNLLYVKGYNLGREKGYNEGVTKLVDFIVFLDKKNIPINDKMLDEFHNDFVKNKDFKK